MIILSHRGFWKVDTEKNSQTAFERSFSLGYGTETDLRDLNGELVISHDPPLNLESNIDFFLNIYNKDKSNLPLALNVKSDGLQNLILDFLKKGSISNYFVFDMSIPDTIAYIKKGMNVFVRQSEYEQNPPLYDEAQGVWLDCFEDIWYNEELVTDHLDNGKKVAIVSSELHKRDHKKHWEILKIWKSINNNNLMLCTDLPTDATKYFENE